MLKNNKLKLVISSATILIPVIIGLILWNKLPTQMPVHWDINGNVDGYTSKAFAVFILPCILLILHLLCMIVTSTDKKNKEQNEKVFSLIFWIVPMISVLCCSMMYAFALGKIVNVSTFVSILLGVIFIIVGNYMPKCKQNKTIGVKIKWTLENEENWKATHRLCGKLWVAGGFATFLCIFLPKNIEHILTVIILVVVVIVPFIYSYLYSKRK